MLDYFQTVNYVFCEITITTDMLEWNLSPPVSALSVSCYVYAAECGLNGASLRCQSNFVQADVVTHQ